MSLPSSNVKFAKFGSVCNSMILSVKYILFDPAVMTLPLTIKLPTTVKLEEKVEFKLTTRLLTVVVLLAFNVVNCPELGVAFPIGVF